MLNFRVDLNLADPPYCEMNKTSHLTFKKRNFLIEHATRHNLIRFEGKHMKSGRVDHVVFCLTLLTMVENKSRPKRQAQLFVNSFHLCFLAIDRKS